MILKRINTADIVEHLEFILKESTISYEPAALNVIARSAEGGMRDALSILDRGNVVLVKGNSTFR